MEQTQNRQPDPLPGHPWTLLRRYAAAVAEAVAAGVSDVQDLTRTQLELLPLEPCSEGWRLSVTGSVLADARVRFRYDRVVASSINPPEVEEEAAASVYLADLQEAITTRCPAGPGEHDL